MLTIIKIKSLDNNYHPIQSQSNRETCWMDGYITVPDHLVDAVWDCMGYCDLVIEDGVLVDIMPTERPEEPETPTDSTDLEARVTALESAIERGLSL